MVPPGRRKVDENRKKGDACGRELPLGTSGHRANGGHFYLRHSIFEGDGLLVGKTKGRRSRVLAGTRAHFGLGRLAVVNDGFTHFRAQPTERLRPLVRYLSHRRAGGPCSGRLCGLVLPDQPTADLLGQCEMALSTFQLQQRDAHGPQPASFHERGRRPKAEQLPQILTAHHRPEALELTLDPSCRVEGLEKGLTHRDFP